MGIVVALDKWLHVCQTKPSKSNTVDPHMKYSLYFAIYDVYSV